MSQVLAPIRQTRMRRRARPRPWAKAIVAAVGAWTRRTPSKPARSAASRSRSRWRVLKATGTLSTTRPGVVRGQLLGPVTDPAEERGHELGRADRSALQRERGLAPIVGDHRRRPAAGDGAGGVRLGRVSRGKEAGAPTQSAGSGASGGSILGGAPGSRTRRTGISARPCPVSSTSGSARPSWNQATRTDSGSISTPSSAVPTGVVRTGVGVGSGAEEGGTVPSRASGASHERGCRTRARRGPVGARAPRPVAGPRRPRWAPPPPRAWAPRRAGRRGRDGDLVGSRRLHGGQEWDGGGGALVHRGRLPERLRDLVERGLRRMERLVPAHRGIELEPGLRSGWRLVELGDHQRSGGRGDRGVNVRRRRGCARARRAGADRGP